MTARDSAPGGRLGELSAALAAALAKWAARDDTKP
jgi:hypothetical protein